VIPTINNFAGYLQNETKFYDLVILTGGVRIDNQKDFAGTNVSAQGNLVFLIHPRYTLRTGVASAFNAPTIMNYVGRLNAAPMPPFTTVQLVGNRNLTAERILYFELGNTIHPTDWLKLRADFFYYRLNKMIDATATIPNPTTLVISYTNDGGAEAIGGEISAEAEICSWLTGFGYWAYEDFDAINGNLSPAGNLGNPKNKVGAGLSGKWLERITANLEFYYVQKRSMEAGVVYNPTFPVSSVGDIYLLNARVGVWPIKEHLELSVSANNILNDNTTQIPPQDLFGIPLAEQPQFMIWGALKYVF